MSVERRVALLCVSPQVSQPDGFADAGSLDLFPSYGIRRVEAALASDPELTGTTVRLFERGAPDIDAFVAEVSRFEPDVVGIATYVWSTASMAEVARRIKRERPETLIVFGGPSAHPCVFDLEPFAGRDYYDALLIGEAEETFAELLHLPSFDRDALAAIPGVALPDGEQWRIARPRVPDPDMNHLPSPYINGMMAPGRVAYLETFRGCPLSCRFCQWGVADANRFLSADSIARELRSIRESGALYTFLVDAALNLHPRAFRNLARAEEEVRWFRDSLLICEIYPNQLTTEHLRFLENVASIHAGVGVQSLDETALQAVTRPFKPERLAPTIEQLSRFGMVDVEIILGLPGDTPETFLRTLETCLQLPCNVRVYRCLVLPNALMTRSPAEYDIRFDPLTLMMTSCHTWPERELRAMQERVSRLAEQSPCAMSGDYWWLFVPSIPAYRANYPLARGHPAGA